jgi:hypothetical protein
MDTEYAEYVVRARDRLRAGLAPRTPTQRAEEILRRLVERRERAARVRRATTQAEKYDRLCALDNELCDLIDAYSAALHTSELKQITSLRGRVRRVMGALDDL